MPQMAPLNWMSLFILFTMMFLIFNSLNYFNFNYPPKILNIKKLMTNNSWKW